MYSHGDRFDHCRLIQADGLRRFEDFTGLDGKILLAGSVRLKSQHLEVVANVVISREAWIAGSAGYLGHEDDFIADGKVFHLRPKFNDRPGYFVALHYRITGVGMLAVENVDVRSANSDALDMNEDLISLIRRTIGFSKFDLTRLSHHRLEHIHTS
jgi:hypothetical protein